MIAWQVVACRGMAGLGGAFNGGAFGCRRSTFTPAR